MMPVQKWILSLTLASQLAIPSNITAQIGGKTAADGPFNLDDFEDIDINSASLQRNWIPDFISGGSFSAVSLAGESGLLPDQSPLGVVNYTMPTAAKAGYIDYSFGIPMPSVAGGSTLTFPGNITSFTHFTFIVRNSILLPNQLNWIILETYPQYPGPTFPKIYWSYDVPTTNTWQRVTIPLREPIQVDNAGGLTLEELLAQTRYLSFYFFGGPQSKSVYVVNVDDIQLIYYASVQNWTLY